MVSTRSRASYTLVIEGRPLALRAPTVLGRDPEALPELGIPASAPLLFGFHSVHKGSQATEG